MEWPSHAFANSLFPSLNVQSLGIIPTFPTEEQVWQIFAEDKDRNLKNQIRILESSNLDLIDRNRLSKTVTFDESKGRVMIESGAVIEPSTHFIGPCFVGKDAIIRHGAYIRENAWVCSSALVGHCSEVKHSILLRFIDD